MKTALRLLLVGALFVAYGLATSRASASEPSVDRCVELFNSAAIALAEAGQSSTVEPFSRWLGAESGADIAQKDATGRNRVRGRSVNTVQQDLRRNVRDKFAKAFGNDFRLCWDRLANWRVKRGVAPDSQVLDDIPPKALHKDERVEWSQAVIVLRSRQRMLAGRRARGDEYLASMFQDRGQKGFLDSKSGLSADVLETARATLVVQALDDLARNRAEQAAERERARERQFAATAFFFAFCGDVPFAECKKRARDAICPALIASNLTRLSPPASIQDEFEHVCTPTPSNLSRWDSLEQCEADAAQRNADIERLRESHLRDLREERERPLREAAAAAERHREIEERTREWQAQEREARRNRVDMREHDSLFEHLW